VYDRLTPAYFLWIFHPVIFCAKKVRSLRNTLFYKGVIKTIKSDFFSRYDENRRIFSTIVMDETEIIAQTRSIPCLWTTKQCSKPHHIRTYNAMAFFTKDPFENPAFRRCALQKAQKPVLSLVNGDC
jgi:hypothetical protein